MVVKIEFTPLPHCNVLPLFEGFFKKSKQNSDKVLQNKKTTIFLQKINKVFLSPVLQNLNGRSVLDK